MLYVSVGTFLLLNFELGNSMWRTCVFVEWQNKIVSVTHNNILLFIGTYWRQVSVFRPSSGHP